MGDGRLNCGRHFSDTYSKPKFYILKAMSHSLNVYYFICQSYPNKAGESYFN